MTLDSIREYCLAFPGATEKIQWGDDLLFCVGGKIFTTVSLEPASRVRVTFKCSPQRFAELLETEGAMAAPYVGRFQWIALEHFHVLSGRELKECIRESYELVAAKLPGKRRHGVARAARPARRQKRKLGPRSPS